MTKKERTKFKLFAEALQIITSKLFNASIQKTAAYDLYLMVLLPKKGKRCLKKDSIRDLLEAGLSSNHPHASFEMRKNHQGYEDSYRGILRNEARAYVNDALTAVTMAIFLGKGDKEFCSIVDKNMLNVCRAYGRCRALEESSGHLHSMIIDFQRQFRGKYPGFDSLAKYNPDDAEYSYPD